VTTRKLLARLAAVGPPIIAQHAKPGARCVLATRVGCDVLAVFGRAAEPVPVLIDIANAAWFAWVAAGQPGGAEGFHARGCWLVSTDDPGIPGLPAQVPPVASPWPGHLVVSAAGWLLDLDAQQLARPKHGIVPPPALLLPWDGQHAAHAFPWGGVRYRRWPADRPLDDYRTSGDWRRGPWPELTGPIVRAVSDSRWAALVPNCP
jgi:hypothetical protein